MQENFKEKLINRAFQLSLKGIKFVDKIQKKGFAAQILAKQFIRSVTSIGANIVEAQGASSTKDFINFMGYAFKSSNETRFWLGLIRDSYDDLKEEAATMLQETQELSKILGKSLLSLKEKQKK